MVNRPEELENSTRVYWAAYSENLFGGVQRLAAGPAEGCRRGAAW